MRTFLSQLDWRFATKKFDKEKKVSPGDLATILEAIRKAPSSLGIQPFHVFVISNEELRKKIRKVSFDQPQTTDAAYLFIFCARNDLDKRTDLMLDLMSGKDPEKRNKLKNLENMLRGSIKSRTKDELMGWSARQAYIALGFGLAATAELGIDSCPMEGFDPKALHEVLELPESMFPFAYMAVGYRKEGPAFPKFRFPKNDLFTFRY